MPRPGSTQRPHSAGLLPNDEKKQKCKNKFVTAFLKAETKPPCLTTADTDRS